MIPRMAGPQNPNEEIVLNVNGGGSANGGSSFVVLGNGGGCLIGGQRAVAGGSSVGAAMYCSPMIVGRPVTETFDLTGGKLPYKLQWVRDGKAITPAALDVRSRRYKDANGKGLEIRYTITPRSVNEILVLNVNGGDPASGGRSLVLMGNTGLCGGIDAA